MAGEETVCLFAVPRIDDLDVDGRVRAVVLVLNGAPEVHTTAVHARENGDWIHGDRDSVHDGEIERLEGSDGRRGGRRKQVDDRRKPWKEVGCVWQGAASVDLGI